MLLFDATTRAGAPIARYYADKKVLQYEDGSKFSVGPIVEVIQDDEALPTFLLKFLIAGLSDTFCVGRKSFTILGELLNFEVVL